MINHTYSILCHDLETGFYKESYDSNIKSLIKSLFVNENEVLVALICNYASKFNSLTDYDDRLTFNIEDLVATDFESVVLSVLSRETVLNRLPASSEERAQFLECRSKEDKLAWVVKQVVKLVSE